MTLTPNLVEDAIRIGADRAVIIDVANIKFEEQVRRYCEMNQCGSYGTNWGCPPGVGTIEELKGKANTYSRGLLVQTIHQIKSSFDLSGMVAGKIEHDRILRKMYSECREKYNFSKQLALSVGGCGYCKKCTYQEGKPCRYPDKAMSSLEAFGINVVDLAKRSGLLYNNGPGTVTYFGLILFS